MIARIFQTGARNEFYLTSDGRITRFSRDELACRCGCGLADMREIAIDALNEARTRFGHPMIPTSGVRCPSHNTAIGGSADSAHMEGLAIDLKSTHPIWDLYEVLGLYFNRVWAYSQSLGLFCHADMRPSRLRRVKTRDGEFAVPEFCSYYRLDPDTPRDRIQEVLETT